MLASNNPTQRYRALQALRRLWHGSLANGTLTWANGQVHNSLVAYLQTIRQQEGLAGVLAEVEALLVTCDGSTSDGLITF